MTFLIYVAPHTRVRRALGYSWGRNTITAGGVVTAVAWYRGACAVGAHDAGEQQCTLQPFHSETWFRPGSCCMQLSLILATLQVSNEARLSAWDIEVRFHERLQ
jgi:hypothetical protein